MGDRWFKTYSGREATLVCLRVGGGHRRILNLNRRMDRATPVENFQAFDDTAKGI